MSGEQRERSLCTTTITKLGVQSTQTNIVIIGNVCITEAIHKRTEAEKEI